jgi:hypothetical protein
MLTIDRCKCGGVGKSESTVNGKRGCGAPIYVWRVVCGKCGEDTGWLSEKSLSVRVWNNMNKLI